MRLIGMRVPSSEVANTRSTSMPAKSIGVAVSSAVRRGSASSSACTHHERGETNVSTAHATAPRPSSSGRPTELTAGSGTPGKAFPSWSKARNARRAAVDVHPPQPGVARRNLLNREIARRHGHSRLGDGRLVTEVEPQYLPTRGAAHREQEQPPAAEHR